MNRVAAGSLACAAAMLVVVGLAHAHTHLESSVPADDSVIVDSPKQIILKFSEPTRLTVMSVQKEGGVAMSITSLPREASHSVTVPFEVAEAGRYEIKWRAIGEDNHVMTGVLHFTVAGK